MEFRVILSNNVLDAILWFSDNKLPSWGFMVHEQGIESEMAQIKAMIEKRKKNKDKMVDRRIREMVEEEDDQMNWW